MRSLPSISVRWAAGIAVALAPLRSPPRHSRAGYTVRVTDVANQQPVRQARCKSWDHARRPHGP
jgi:hypothetical protein